MAEDSLSRALRLAKERMANMTPEERQAMWKEQRQSWARGQVAMMEHDREMRTGQGSGDDVETLRERARKEVIISLARNKAVVAFDGKLTQLEPSAEDNASFERAINEATVEDWHHFRASFIYHLAQLWANWASAVEEWIGEKS